MPPRAFFFSAAEEEGWERMEMRPLQELVVKKEGWEFMAVRRGIIGASSVPFGDLSVSVHPRDAIVADFLFSNSIAALLSQREDWGTPS